MKISHAYNILTTRVGEKRAVETHKWLFIALFLDNMQGKDIGAFVR